MKRLDAMARRNYLVEGLSGVGKSSVHEELIRRGYQTINTDWAWAYNAEPDAGLPGGTVGHATRVWDQQEAVRELARRSSNDGRSIRHRRPHDTVRNQRRQILSTGIGKSSAEWAANR